MRPKRFPLVLPLLLLLAFGFALAQPLPEPVDPLKRPEPEPGKLTFSASFGYTPTTHTAFGLDETRGPYTDQTAIHGFSTDFALSYALTRTLSFGIGITGALSNTQTLRTYTDETQAYQDTTETDLTPRIALAYRLAPNHPLDPSASLSLAYPWATSASLSPHRALAFPGGFPRLPPALPHCARGLPWGGVFGQRPGELPDLGRA